jgi:CrcB protein
MGVLLRFMLSGLAHQYLAAMFPVGTLLVNLVGCFVIGIMQTIFLKFAVVRREVQLFVTVGLIGSFTTFSAISVETVRLIQAGLVSWALGYQALTLIGGMAAVALGAVLTQTAHRRINRLRT